MKQTLKYLIVQACIASLVYMGFFLDIEPARNIVLFIFWLEILCTPAIFSRVSMKLMARSKLAPGFTSLVDACYVIVLAAFGATATAVFYALRAIILYAAKVTARQAGKDGKLKA